MRERSANALVKDMKHVISEIQETGRVSREMEDEVKRIEQILTCPVNLDRKDTLDRSLRRKIVLTRKEMHQCIELARHANSPPEPGSSLKLVSPPGKYWKQLGKMCFSKKRYELEVEPAVADWRHDDCEANSPYWYEVESIVIRIRHTWGLLKIFGLLSVLIAIGKAIKSFMSSGK